MSLLSAFLPYMRGKLHGCPEIIMEDAVREASIEFCKRSRLLINDVTIHVLANVRFCEIWPPDGVHYILDKVMRDGYDLYASSRNEFEARRYDVDSGTPTAYYMEGDGRLTLGPVPDASETLTAKVTIRPEDTATEVPDILFSEWRDVIASGAKAWIRKSHAAWADESEKAIDTAEFERGIARATMQLATGNTRRPLRATAHFY